MAKIFGINIDPTPGFNLGVTDLWNRSARAGNSFQGSTPNQVYTNNPTGQNRSSNKPTPKINNGNNGQVKSEQTGDVPNYTPYSTGSGGGGGGGGSSNGDALMASYYDDQANQLQRLLQSADTSLGQGLAGLSDSYNLQNSRINEDQSRTLRDYGIKRQDTLSAKDRALQQVDTDSRNGFNALQRLIQGGGGGVSSAARELAPYAVSLKGTQERGQQLDTFGRNTRNLDIAEEDAKMQYRNALDDLFRQKREKESALQQGVISKKQQLVNQIAEAKANAALSRGQNYKQAQAGIQPLRDQFNSYQNSLDSLFDQFRNPTYDVKAVNAQKPDLAQYTVDRAAIDAGQANPDVPSEVLPYLPNLKDENKLSYLL